MVHDQQEEKNILYLKHRSNELQSLTLNIFGDQFLAVPQA